MALVLLLILNFLVAVHEGKKNVESFLDGTVIVSVISEIELLGWYKIKPEEMQTIRLLLDDCVLFELTSDIRRLAIEMRQQAKDQNLRMRL